MSAFDYSFDALDGTPLPLSKFRGKAVLVVNVASLCGFTPQYAGLQQLWQRYRDRGLVVLGVPSNDFGGQEPGTATEIQNFCSLNYGVDFPLTAKVATSGVEAHPFYRWVAGELGDGALPRWNFHKYLIDPEGRISALFPSQVTPEANELTEAIEAVLPAAADHL